MRKLVLASGLVLMIVGAIAGLVVGHQVRACASLLLAAAQRNDVDAYNAGVSLCNALVEQRSMAFGVVIVGALVAAAPTGYETLTRLARRDP